jgi:hypothetical protein
VEKTALTDVTGDSKLLCLANLAPTLRYSIRLEFKNQNGQTLTRTVNISSDFNVGDPEIEENDEENEVGGSERMSPGAIAGIACGGIAALALGMAIGAAFMRRKKPSSSTGLVEKE